MAANLIRNEGLSLEQIYSDNVVYRDRIVYKSVQDDEHDEIMYYKEREIELINKYNSLLSRSKELRKERDLAHDYSKKISLNVNSYSRKKMLSKLIIMNLNQQYSFCKEKLKIRAK